jgi:hypothetical protein
LFNRPKPTTGCSANGEEEVHARSQLSPVERASTHTRRLAKSPNHKRSFMILADSVDGVSLLESSASWPLCTVLCLKGAGVAQSI